MMPDVERGVIVHRQRSQQIKDYSGLRYGLCTPTDLDGMLDFGDKAWVMIEYKYEDAQMPHGQRLCLERLVDDLQRTKPSILIVAQHHHPVLEDIDCAHALVEEYRYEGKWRVPRERTTVRVAIDKFRESIGLPIEPEFNLMKGVL